MALVAIGEQQTVDARGVDELTRGAGADRTDADDERGRHGPIRSLARSPKFGAFELAPTAGGRRHAALAAHRASIPTAPAAPSTSSRRLKTFTTRECIEHELAGLRRPASAAATATLLRLPGGYSSVG